MQSYCNNVLNTVLAGRLICFLAFFIHCAVLLRLLVLLNYTGTRMAVLRNKALAVGSERVFKLSFISVNAITVRFRAVVRMCM
jgi:hypothetical protein